MFHLGFFFCGFYFLSKLNWTFIVENQTKAWILPAASGHSWFFYLIPRNDQISHHAEVCESAGKWGRGSSDLPHLKILSFLLRVLHLHQSSEIISSLSIKVEADLIQSNVTKQMFVFSSFHFSSAETSADLHRPSVVLMEALGKYDFMATSDTELSFRKGDILKVGMRGWTCSWPLTFALTLRVFVPV